MDQQQSSSTPVIDGQTPLDQARKIKLKPDQYAVDGVVSECLPNTMFRVEVLGSDIPELVGRVLLFTLAGKMRLNRIRVMPGDKVQGYVTKYDLQRGKIVFRTK